jgi:hypothetical protein
MAAAAVVIAMAGPGPADAAAAAPAPSWPQLGGSAAHTSDEPNETSVTRQNVGKLAVSWTQPIVPCDCGSIVPSQVTVTGGTAYVAKLVASSAAIA